MFRWPPLGVSAGGGWVGPPVNDHQMSVARGVAMSHVWEGGGIPKSHVREGRRPGPMSEGYRVIYPMIGDI